MPADRTRNPSGSNGGEFVWTAPISTSSSPSASSSLGSSVIFQIDSQQIHPPRRVSAPTRKKDKAAGSAHIPRPPNAFILFRSSFIRSQKISTSIETNHSTLSKIIGLTWQNLPEEEKEVWHEQAKKALEEHKRRFPGYAFRPNGKAASVSSAHKSQTAKASPSTSSFQVTLTPSPSTTEIPASSPTKRRIREVEPKDDIRCAQIASLLVRGLKGEELEKEMAQFDKNHVKRIETRFEKPITEDAFKAKAQFKRRKLEKQASAPAVLTSFPAPEPTPCPPELSIFTTVISEELSPSPLDTPLSSVPPTPTFGFDSFSFLDEQCSLPMEMFAPSEFDPAAISPPDFLSFDFASSHFDLPPLVDLPPILPTSSPDCGSSIFDPSCYDYSYDVNSSFGLDYLTAGANPFSSYDGSSFSLPC